MILPPTNEVQKKCKRAKRCKCKSKTKKKWHTLLKGIKHAAFKLLKSTHIGKKAYNMLYSKKRRATISDDASRNMYWKNNANLYKIYRNIITYPRLNSVFENINITTFIFEEEPKKTARFYAGLLWNWKLTTSPDTWTVHLHFIKRCLHLCIKYMDDKDFQIVKTHLQYNHGKEFQEVALLHDTSSIKSYLWTTLSRSEIILNMLVETINHWFLCTPILLELAKITGWGFLQENDASLLGVDALYGILLNAAYNSRPYNLQKVYY